MAHVRDIAVFLSSTFRDLQLEREVLIKTAVPQLAEYCAARGATLRVVDLRWGVTTDQAERNEVVEICLREVDRCRPFFVAILGQRYGWIPSKHDDRVVTQFPWIREYPGASLTELEIRHGALNWQGDAHARFYLRDPAFLSSLSTSEQALYVDEDREAKAKLAALTAEIRRSRFPATTFTSAEALGRMLVDDLIGDLEPILGAEALLNRRKRVHVEVLNNPSATKTAQEEMFRHERVRHEVKERALDREYIDLQDRVGVLRRFFASEASVLCIRGPAGAGKSHLLARFGREVAARPDPPLLVSYFKQEAGVGRIGYLTWAIRQKLGREAWLGLDAQTEDLHQTLADANEGPGLLLAIDGGDDTSVDWANDGLPPRCKVVFAVDADSPLPKPLPSTWSSYDLPTPSAEEAKRFLSSHLGQYGKQLSPGQLDQLTAGRDYPTFGVLQRLAEELRVFGVFEKLGSVIESLLAATSDVEFYTRVLGRIGEDSVGRGATLSRLLQALLVLPQGTLTHEEAMATLELGAIEWMELRALAEVLLVTERPFDVKLRPAVADAVQLQFVATADERREIHAWLADHYKPMKRRNPTEVDEDALLAARAYHVSEAGRNADLEMLLGGVHAVRVLGDKYDSYLTKVSPDARSRIASLHDAAARANLDHPDPSVAEALIDLARACRRGGDLDREALMISSALASCRSGDSVFCWSAIFEGKTTLRRQLTRAADIMPELALGIARATFQLNRDDLDAATLFVEALARPILHEPSNRDKRIEILHALGWTYLHASRPADAFESFERMESLLAPGDSSLHRRQALSGRASALSAQERLSEALPLAEEALKLCLDDPAPTLGFHEFASNYAGMVFDARKSDAATVDLLERALSRPELADPQQVVTRVELAHRIGFALWRSGDRPERALQLFRETQALLDVTAQPVLFADACAGAAYILNMQSRLADALVEIQRAIAIYETTDRDEARKSLPIAVAFETKVRNRLM